MNEETKTAKPAAKAKASAKPKKPRGRRKPTAEDIARAVEKQAKATAAAGIGGVIGLEEGWTTQIIDTANPAGKVTQDRARAEAVGFELAADLKVAGMASGEVWVMPSEVYNKTIRAQRQQRDDELRRKCRIG